MLIFFWKNAAGGGNIGVGQAAGAAQVIGVGGSTGGTIPTVAGIRLRLLVDIAVGNGGQSLRRTLLNQENTVAAWSHSDLVTEFGSRDLVQKNHGVYEGIGFTQGITVDNLAEGGIATNFNGQVQIRVAHDGLTGGRNLSLAGGDMDLFIHFRTVVNDANDRGIITKYDPVTNNGWFIHVQGGQLRGGLRVAGSEIFSFQSVFVSNGIWHVAHLCVTGGQARWTVDGTTGSPVSASTEPQVTGADVIIGGWYGVDNSARRFIGDLHYVMIGREGRSSLGAEAYASLAWTDISDDVTAMDVELGTPTETPLGVTAGTSKAHFKLLNSAPVGRYSYGHANALSGFNLANPVRIRTYDGTTIRPLFRGMISDINPATGANGERQTAIDCVDWMEVPAVSPIGDVEVVLNKTSDYCIKRLCGIVNRPPAAVEFDLGNEVFPTAFDQVDGVQGKVMQEIADVTYNEGGQTYVKRDGTLRHEGRQRRQLPTTPIATLFGDWQDIQVGMGLHNIINLQRATVYPREFGDGTDTVVAGAVSSGSTKTRQHLTPGSIVPVQVSYRDPEEKSQNAGAMDIQTLVPGVDYTMTEFEDGSGADLTSFVEFISGNPPKSGSSFTLEVRNNHAFQDGWFHTQVRGRIIRRFEPQSTYYKDGDSENQFLPREPPTMNLRYLADIDAGYSRCKFMVNVFKNPAMRPRQMVSLLNPTTTVMTNFLDFELGALVKVSEPVTAINNIGYWIQAMRYSFRENNILTMTVTLVPSNISGPVFIVGDATLGVVGTAVVGY